MHKILTRKLAPLLLLLLPLSAFNQAAEDYLAVLRQDGAPPLQFVHEQLSRQDLLIFDDALHPAVEPFEFYQELLKREKDGIDFVFVEVFSVKNQADLDRYFASTEKDSTYLMPVFQDGFSGYGWRYETYLDLFSTIWDINAGLPEADRIKVIGADQPIYWEGLHSRADYDAFQKSLVGRDYYMYQTILGYMEDFRQDKKGIFLTNTRHAYKHIRKADGSLYWNCGTFFNQWHPGRTYSIRFHNVQLSIDKKRESGDRQSTEGLDRVEYRWIRMENGIWDQAFQLNGNQPVAISFRDNVFGEARYVGNHMLNGQEGQRMYDAYDALIFLAPLEQLHFAAQIDFIFTEAFKKELKRRIELLNENAIAEFLEQNKVSTVEEFIEQLARYRPEAKNGLVPN